MNNKTSNLDRVWQNIWKRIITFAIWIANKWIRNDKLRHDIQYRKRSRISAKTPRCKNSHTFFARCAERLFSWNNGGCHGNYSAAWEQLVGLWVHFWIYYGTILAMARTRDGRSEKNWRHRRMRIRIRKKFLLSGIEAYYSINMLSAKQRNEPLETLNKMINTQLAAVVPSWLECPAKVWIGRCARRLFGFCSRIVLYFQ